VDKGVILKHNETKGRTGSADKISKVILHFASVQSNSVALESSCQSMVHGEVKCVGLGWTFDFWFLKASNSFYFHYICLNLDPYILLLRQGFHYRSFYTFFT